MPYINANNLDLFMQMHSYYLKNDTILNPVDNFKFNTPNIIYLQNNCGHVIQIVKDIQCRKLCELYRYNSCEDKGHIYIKFVCRPGNICICDTKCICQLTEYNRICNHSTECINTTCRNKKQIVSICAIQYCNEVKQYMTILINITIRRLNSLKKISYLWKKYIFNKYCHLLRIHIALQNYYSKKIIKHTVKPAIIKNKATDVLFNSRLSRHITGFLFNIKSYKPKNDTLY